MVHPACIVLAIGVARVGPLSDCLAAASTVSDCRNSRAWCTQPSERPILLACSRASRAANDLIVVTSDSVGLRLEVKQPSTVFVGLLQLSGLQLIRPWRCGKLCGNSMGATT